MATFDAAAPWTTLPDSVKGNIMSYICHPVAQLIKEFDAQREAAPYLRRLGAVQAEKRDVMEMLGHFRTLEWQYVLMNERLSEELPRRRGSDARANGAYALRSAVARPV